MEPEAHFAVAEIESEEPRAAAKARWGRFSMDAAWWSTFGLLMIAMGLTVAGELLLKTGVNRHGSLELSLSQLLPTAWKLFTNFFIVGGFALVFGGSLFWLVVLSRWDLSLAYPLLSINYIIGIGLSALILKEQVSWLQLGGVLVIIAGVTLVSIGHPGSQVGN
jgi:drug/metabolite transporter (DMT)-like permease